MKNNFVTGLLILLPIFITFMLVRFFVHLLTDPFLGIVQYFWVGAPSTLKFVSQLLILASLFALTLIVGIVGKLFLVEVLINLGNRIIEKIPIISKIFKAIKDVIHSLFVSDNPSFSKAVLVPFPGPQSYSIGFITKESDSNKDLISVFVVGTPNPTMGFMLNVPPDQIIPLKMNVRNAFKFILSCGVIHEA